MAASSISPSPSPSSSQELPILYRDTKSVVNHLKLSKNIEEIKRIHCQITKHGLFHLPTASSNLIYAYSRAATAQSLDYAIKAFELFCEEHKATLFLWNSLIRGFSSSGHVDEAVELFVQMVDEGFVPDHFTFRPLLAGFTKAFAFQEGAWLHGLLLKVGSYGGVQDDIFIQNSLIHFYAEHGELESAHRVFDNMLERNVVSWTSLIAGYAHGDDPRKAVHLFWDMVADNKIAPNSVSVACAVSACAKLQDFESGERLFTYAVDVGIDFSINLVNTLVDLYMKCGAVEVAERLFHECTDRNIVLWNTMLSNYARHGMAHKAVALFNDMLISGTKPDRVTIVAAASASAQLGEAMTGRRFHGYILRNSLDVWHDVSNSMIDIYMKCRELDAAFRIFDPMKEKTVVSWNTVINGCIRNGDWRSAWKHFEEMPWRDHISWNTMIAALVQESWFEDAMTLFREMQSSGMRPDRVTMLSVASACGYLGALDLAKWTYAYINKNKISTEVKLNTALVDMFARCGDTKSSLKIFEKMQNKDASAWTAAIGAMAVEGNGRRAIYLFSEMIKDGLKPDTIAFVQVLTACSHGGLVEEGRQFFPSMTKDFRFAPQVIHYGCMVDLLGRAGLLGEARMLIESMPMEPNDIVWGALLAASCVHHDLEQAEFAAERVLELSPGRSGIYVLLSNVYASAGRWKDVAEVRLLLKDKGVQKLPGSSLIEIEGMIHEFTSSNESHSQMELISEMLQEMGHKLSLAGYVPDLDKVLLDVNEEEKEFLLSRHSEKMAVAYGLISTGRGVPIRIVKNLRICSDCHSFMKLVSAIYDREITVRDNNRFHHFEKGQCSCSDYW
ncbi:pentatricopeptide repeat-containing protein At3g22690 [Dendrobium catenatum]|uniref:Pentatricopeptide repeat-containing protein n=1 Tax=Dendrobium catenatum TaxID=906689 RepID=A0A2I0WUP5_9ASPA|nr:pentatricopeptide repeat-containing protein At3g22690 [Dendrobium catenatum]PKU79388.1 Pentatricopeptide repeat-containing protein [Dendrobium catenatum]